MKTIFNFLVEPKGDRYANKKDNNGKELILNTELQNHSFTNRIGIVKTVPLAYNTDIQVGDEVVVHHNVFRRFHDIRGDEKNSRNYYEENKYFVNNDQLFMYKRNGSWMACDGFCFVKPIKDDSAFSEHEEKPLVGIVKYKDKNDVGFEVGDLVGFRPNSEYEFFIEGNRYYRVPNHFITIKYEYKGNEAEYNTSWEESC